METLNLKDLKLTANESKDIIKLIAKKRSTTTKKMLETINQNQKRRINKKLTKKQEKLTETQQKLIETQQKLKITPKKYHKLTEKYYKLTEKQQKIIKSQKSHQKIKSQKLPQKKNK